MRIALTGAAGIGKTTLAQHLARRFNVGLLHEDFAGIVHAFITPLPEQVEHCRTACIAWLQQREILYQSNESFIEDRCAIDVLFRWLLGNVSDLNNDETHSIMTRTKGLLDQLDYVVIPPFSETRDSHNHDGISRLGSTSRLFRAQSLAIGIAMQLVEPSRLIVIPNSCHTSESRERYVMEIVSNNK